MKCKMKGRSSGFARKLTELLRESGEKTTSIPPAASICKCDAVTPWTAAPSIPLDKGHRRGRAAHSFFRTVRVFLSGLIDSSAFQEVSLGREVSIIFTSNGPLIYRWEANNANNGKPDRLHLGGRKS
jgi:hypothetical protein